MGIKLKIERIKKGFTQEKLSKESGVCRSLISRAENGDYSKLTHEKMLKISNALEVSVNDLFFESK